MNVNRVFLGGNLTRDIEVSHTTGNQTLGKFGIAVNRKFKTAAGESREEVVFVDCTAWGKTAEVMAQYLSKGSSVFVEGRLKLDQWDDKKSGEKRSKLTVVVENFQFVGGPAEKSKSTAKPGSAPASKFPPTEDEEIPF